MSEREPDFEDEKIRMWKEPLDSPDRPAERDDTVMDVNFRLEEIYESRAYQVLETTPTLLAVATWLVDGARPATPNDFALLLMSVSAESSLKILSKRNRTDGRVTYHVTFVNDYGRILLERQDVEHADAYQWRVAELEDESLATGLLAEPVVVSHAEWQKYEQERGT